MSEEKALLEYGTIEEIANYYGLSVEELLNEMYGDCE